MMWLATILAYAASKVAPRSMRPVFAAYCVMLKRFPVELKLGRSYGAITVPWSIDPEQKGRALLSAMDAAKAARANIDAMGRDQ